MADIERKVENSSAVREELSKEIDGLKKFKKESIKFYDKKISEIKGLSSKLNTYKPMEQLKKIS
jgi:seryl-tRNA synthetase